MSSRPVTHSSRTARLVRVIRCAREALVLVLQGDAGREVVDAADADGVVVPWVATSARSRAGPTIQPRRRPASE
ncbi:hypothetical protein ADK70_04790 [Streptomyces rimosus subsp. pseudoverticillatus]|nr:hypothetical protein ADK70_04790 [Streptomyces rimosus subsp. pseudoverticillatus]